MKQDDKPNLALLAAEDRDKCIEAIISYFYNERGETIGVIAAAGILDFFLDSAGIDIYNKGIEDAKKCSRVSWTSWISNLSS